MRFISMLVVLIISVFGVAFAILNSESVTINYYVSQVTLPLSLLSVLVFSVGCLLGMVVNAWFMIRAKLTERRLRYRVQQLETEVQQLRSLPVQEMV